MRRSCWVLVGLLCAVFAFAAEDTKDKPQLVLDAGGHTGPVAQLLFSPNGKRLISVSADRTVRLWDTGSGESFRVLRLPFGVENRSSLPDEGHGAALAAEGRLLAVAGPAPAGGRQHWVYLIDLADNKVVRVFKGFPKPVSALAFSPDGKTLATGEDLSVRLWDVEKGTGRPPLLGHTAPVRAVAFSPDGKALASTGIDKTVRLWSTATGNPDKVLTLADPRENADRMHGVAWSPDGQTVASVCNDTIVYVWSIDGTRRPSLQRRARGQGVAFFPDGRRLLAGRSLLDLASGKELLEHAPLSGVVYSAALSRDGKRAACGTSEGEVLLWDTKDGSLVHRLAGSGALINNVAWAPDGKTIWWHHPPLDAEQKQRKARRETFDLAELKFGGREDKTWQHARHVLPEASLEKTADLQLTVKRGAENVVLKLPAGIDNIQAFSFLDDKRVVVGTMRGLHLYDAVTGKHLRHYQGIGQVGAVTPSADNRYFLTGGLDQTLRVWDPEREEPLLSLYPVGNDWIAWTPEGYYAASPGGERLMGWQVNNGPEQLASFYPASQFRKSLYRPDVISRLLEAGSVAEALKRADQEGNKKTPLLDVEQVLPPRVVIVEPAKSGTVTEPKVTVKAVAESVGKNPIKELQLLLDDRPYEGTRGVRGVAEGQGSKTEKEWVVELTPGPHRMTVVARSAVSKGVSEAIELEYKPAQTPPTATKPTLYVLSIGINKYPGDLELDCAVNDATELTKSLQANSQSLFQVVTKVLTDKDASRAGILGALGELKNQMKPHDTAVIFYAGHGHRAADGSFYLLSSDMDVDHLKTTAVPRDDLKKQLADLPGRVLLLLDACHSAASGRLSKMIQSKGVGEDFVRDLSDDDCGVVVMCAAMGREESRESDEKKHGYFTLAILEGLAGKADFNKDGVVDLHELDFYVERRVAELSEDKQHPSIDKPSAIRWFALAKP